MTESFILHRAILAQSETCFHREYNLAAAIRRMIFLQATDNLLHTIMKEAGTVFSVPALQISVPGGIRTHDLPLVVILKVEAKEVEVKVVVKGVDQEVKVEVREVDLEAKVVVREAEVKVEVGAKLEVKDKVKVGNKKEVNQKMKMKKMRRKKMRMKMKMKVIMEVKVDLKVAPKVAVKVLQEVKKILKIQNQEKQVQRKRPIPRKWINPKKKKKKLNLPLFP